MSSAGLGASMMGFNRPQLAAPQQSRRSSILDEAISATVQRGFDIDLVHVMDDADEKLIADEILHGTTSGAFVYSFKISGKLTTGISVVGAKHLARMYGGLKHRIVASVEKRGTLHVFRSYPDGSRPMQVTTSVLPELADEDDYYTSIVEITDIKTGNSFQAEKTESRIEYRQDGTPYQRPNFQTIAQSKAYRNAILALVPQDVQARFKAECLKNGDSKDMTEGAIDKKRAGVMTFATKHALPITREGVASLDWDQISGLSQAASEGGLAAFVNSCKALGLLGDGGEPGEQEQSPPPPAKPKGEPKPKAAPQPKAEPKPTVESKPAKAEPQRPDYDPETGEILDDEPAGENRQEEEQEERPADPQPQRRAAPKGSLFGNT